MKRPLIVVVLAALVIGACLCVYWFGLTNRTSVRNSAGGDIRNVELVLEEHNGKRRTSRTVALLKQGESFTVRHSIRDLTVRLMFLMDGQSHTHIDGYVDLWTGEGWILDIQPSGDVRSGYDYPRAGR